MSDEPSIGTQMYGDVAPVLAGLFDRVLFGEVWQRPELANRDKSLITVAALIAGYRINELPIQFKFALQNGVSPKELAAVVTHLAFYSGWPTAHSALPILRKVLAEAGRTTAEA